MLTETYIRSTAAISPQKTFGNDGIPEFEEYTEVNYLKCIEPVYRDFLDPMASRRMSRLVKMGVCSALHCLKKAGIDIPDAIITGTGLGCIEDTEKFLGSVFTQEEKLLNPTPFIQSTHNTVAAAIALALKCYGYNATYTHRGFSFETAMADAMLQLAENPASNVLAGGFDELTSNSYAITRRLGLWRTHPVNTLRLLYDAGKGALPGEGVAFFLLTGKPGNENMARLDAMHTFYNPAGGAACGKQLEGFIRKAGLEPGDINLVMLGLKGDVSGDALYSEALRHAGLRTNLAAFKHLCGEYDTATSFALWLSAEILRTGAVPAQVSMGPAPGSVKNILIYNHLRGHNHALYLLSA